MNDRTSLRKTAKRRPYLQRTHLKLEGERKFFLNTFLSEWSHTLEGLTCIWKTGINAHISLRKQNLKLVKLPKKVSILSFQKNTNFVNE